MEQDKRKLIEKLAELIEDLGFDYDRLSTSGRLTYDEIQSIMIELNS